MPYNAVLQNLHVLFSSKYYLNFEPGAVVRPFAGLATVMPGAPAFNIIKDSIVYTDPYLGMEYPKHTIRRGVGTNMNISIPEGTLIAIVVGIRADNVTEEQAGAFNVSGGLFFS